MQPFSSANLHGVVVLSDDVPSREEHLSKTRDLQTKCVEALNFSKELHQARVKVDQKLSSLRVAHQKSDLQARRNSFNLRDTKDRGRALDCQSNVNISAQSRMHAVEYVVLCLHSSH